MSKILRFLCQCLPFYLSASFVIAFFNQDTYCGKSKLPEDLQYSTVTTYHCPGCIYRNPTFQERRLPSSYPRRLAQASSSMPLRIFPISPSLVVGNEPISVKQTEKPILELEPSLRLSIFPSKWHTVLGAPLAAMGIGQLLSVERIGLST